MLKIFELTNSPYIFQLAEGTGGLYTAYIFNIETKKAFYMFVKNIDWKQFNNRCKELKND